jgi:hypothetical protein
MRLAVVHGRWLEELGTVFQLVWVSAWGFQAHAKLGGILSLTEFPYVPMPPIPFLPAEKVPAVAAYVRSRPVAWVDDVITPEAVAWAESRPAPTLLLQTDPRRGLERPHVDQLLTWGRSLDSA